MVQFGKKLLESQYEPWAKYYLDYKLLKKCLAKHKNQNRLLQGDVPPPPPGHYQSQEHQIEWGSPGATSGTPISVESPQMSHDDSEYTHHTHDHSTTTQVVAHNDNRDFETILEDEVEKIGLFFLQIQGEIAADLNVLRSSQAKFLRDLEAQGELTALHAVNEADPEDSPTMQTFYVKFHALAVTLLRLIHFVEANVTGIRKILKKHDKVTKQHLTYQYVSFYLGGKKSLELKHLWTNLLLHQYEGITALNVTMKVALAELKNVEYQQQRLSTLSTNSTGRPPLSNHAHQNHHQRPPRPTSQGAARHQPIKSMPNIVLSPEDVAEAMAAVSDSRALVPSGGGINNNKSLTPQPLSSKKPYGSTRQLMEMQKSDITANELDAVLLKVEAARRRLNISSSTFQDMLAAQIVMLEPTGSEDGIPDEDADEEDVDAKDDKWLSHFLNLTSTFLYMTNYYVVAPTSGHYAEMLGGDEALAGIIIGMTPIAALVSTILYSWWTSYSYKAALVFASTCSILGNVFYALGLPFNSMTFVMIGRLLNGFGSARSINRRYIADTFPPRQRTAQSANFVTAGALGMAAGPAIASLLHIGSPSTNGSDPANVWWTPENAPGWFMFVVWSVFLVLLLFHFEDPPKHNTERAKVAVANGTEATKEEKQALLAKVESNSDRELFGDEEKEVPIWKNVPVMTTFVVYFVLKLILECLLSSTATLTDFYFHWDSSISGIYLAVLGLLMLPANLVIALLARNHDDRELIVGCEVMMLIGCLGIIQYTVSREAYLPIQYIVFSVVIFVSTNGLEGPNMSLLSKTIPKSWSKGIFNVGLLATEAGTLGRAVGDLLLSAWGFKGLGTLLNYTFRTMSILSTMSLALTLYFYEYMEANEKDD